ncbi:MAG: hypothetical protein ABI461_14810, partial [Polyangiaceae bacterium]
MRPVRLSFSLFRDAGAVLAAWGVLMAAEQLAVGFGYRRLFVGTWEMGAARTQATPIALALLLPLALLIALARPLFAEISERRFPRLLIAALAGELALLTGLAVTHGRHFARVDLRIGFVATLVAITIALVYA